MSSYISEEELDREWREWKKLNKFNEQVETFNDHNEYKLKIPVNMKIKSKGK